MEQHLVVEIKLMLVLILAHILKCLRVQCRSWHQEIPGKVTVEI